LKRDCSGNWLFGWFLGHCLGCCSVAFWYLLGSIACRMFRSCSEGLVIVDWIRLIFMKQDLCCYQVRMLPIYRSNPVLMQSALYSRCRGGSDEPITARTNLYTCLCIQEFNTSHLPDQVQGKVACLATPSQGVCRITRLLTEGPGPTSSPGSLPAPRVACHCSPAGFDRQQIRSSRVCKSRASKMFPSSSSSLMKASGP
jgi:hypothetical protein